MYKNFSPSALGISGRQSELVELALTYHFRGIDANLRDLVKRAETKGVDYAARILRSAKLRIGGFELPVAWRKDDATFRSELQRIGQIAEMAHAIGATRSYLHVMPAGDEMPYHENFELHRRRFSELAEALEPHNIRLGLAILAGPSHRQDRAYPYICQPDALLTLVKTISRPNVGVVLDTWNWFVGGGTLEQIQGLKADQIVIVRLADIPADVDLASIRDDQRVVPREAGRVDCVGVLRHLGRIDYEGPLSLTASPGRHAGMTRDAIAQRSSEALEDLMRAAGINKAGKLAPVTAGA